jgi:tRNA (guanine-N7-)-methyltransferase
MSDELEQARLKHRRIRSFVVRAGRMTTGQERAWKELWPLYGIEFTGALIDLERCFGRKAPCVLEIGFGTGDALLAYAQQHPEHNCLGIEVHPPGVGHLMLQVHDKQLANVRVICRDAVEVLVHSLPPRSLDEVHVFFPDPWHKKRHHKRRLIQTAFVDLLALALKPGGSVRLATDWENYAEQMRTVMDSHSAFANLALADPQTPSGYTARPEHRPLTRFERRGHRLGHGVWDMLYRRGDT